MARAISLAGRRGLTTICEMLLQGLQDGRRVMTKDATPRRIFLGACALVGAAGAVRRGRAEVDAGPGPEMVRRWYRSWDTTKDWHQADLLLADDFTFTSAAGDDHISKTEFKANCWDTQINHIKRFDLLHVFAHDDAAFVMYDCITSNSRSLRNVEFLQFKDGRIKSIECYFGAKSNFPSAVSNRQG